MMDWLVAEKDGKYILGRKEGSWSSDEIWSSMNVGAFSIYGHRWILSHISLEDALNQYNYIYKTKLPENQPGWRAKVVLDEVELIGDWYVCGIGTVKEGNNLKQFIARGRTHREMLSRLTDRHGLQNLGWNIADVMNIHNVMHKNNLRTDDDYWLNNANVELIGFDDTAEKTVICDCGAEKTNSTHYDWCSTKVRA